MNIFDSQPINQIQWIEVERLKPNDYNPNTMAQNELSLLAVSILYDGWTQPIVVTEDLDIVDGFHRWKIANTSKEIQSLTNGKVPVVILKNKTRPEKQLATIRHNRAKGTHGINQMSTILSELINTYNEKELQTLLGMKASEVQRLKDNLTAFKKLESSGYTYFSNAKG